MRDHISKIPYKWLFGGDYNSANFYWLAKYNLYLHSTLWKSSLN